MTDLQTLQHFLQFPLSSGTEILNQFATLPGAIHLKDSDDELKQLVFIPGSRHSKVLLVAHCDTVWEHPGYTINPVLVEKNGIISSGLPNYGIGSDDRAGCAILWLMRNSGHSLLILHGEEKGRVGAKYLMRQYPELGASLQVDHCFALEFDKRHGNEYKCYSVGSNPFRYYVQELTGFFEPNRYAYTDICTLCTIICGANLSVGYYKEHTPEEYLVISEWLHTLELTRKWLAPLNLPRFVQASIGRVV